MITSLLVFLWQFLLKEKTPLHSYKMNINTENLDKTIEHWASIDGYLNYQVSWWGRVVNTKTGLILRARTSPLGYQRVNWYIDGKQKTHTIHQLVAREWVRNPGEKQCVDHIDGNRKNNHWENLRYATHTENARNSAKTSKPTSSIYKGVCFHTRHDKWIANVQLGRKLKHLGYFVNEREAAEAYNAAAVLHYTNFAKLNTLD